MTTWRCAHLALLTAMGLGVLGCGTTVILGQGSGTTSSGTPGGDVGPSALDGDVGALGCIVGEPAPIISDTRPGQVVMDDVYLYWADQIANEKIEFQWEIVRAPKGGGIPEVVDYASDSFLDITVDQTNVYWRWEANTTTPPQHNEIRSIAKNGGPETVLFSADQWLVYTIADPDRIFLLADDLQHDEVLSVPRDGGAPTVLASRASAGGPPAFLLADEQRLYWFDQATQEIVSLSKSGGAVTVLASFEWVERMFVDAEDLYWIGSDALVDGSPGIYRMPKAGGSPIRLYESSFGPDNALWGLAMDDKCVYWTQQTGWSDKSLGLVGAVAKDGGGAGILTRRDIGDIAIDENGLYLTAPAGNSSSDLPPPQDGAVLKIAR